MVGGGWRMTRAGTGKPEAALRQPHLTQLRKSLRPQLPQKGTFIRLEKGKYKATNHRRILWLKIVRKSTVYPCDYRFGYERAEKQVSLQIDFKFGA